MQFENGQLMCGMSHLKQEIYKAGKQELIMHHVTYFVYFHGVLSCQSVSYGMLRISLGQILDAIVSSLKKILKINKLRRK